MSKQKKEHRQEKLFEKSVPTDLEEAAEKCIDDALFKWSYDDEDGIEQYVHDAFIAGAKWQENKDQETIKLAEDHAFLAGADWQKEQGIR